MQSDTNPSHYMELYERRMRRFNLAVILAAGAALALATIVMLTCSSQFV
jgi:hypothetical protein